MASYRVVGREEAGCSADGNPDEGPAEESLEGVKLKTSKAVLQGRLLLAFCWGGLYFEALTTLGLAGTVWPGLVGRGGRDMDADGGGRDMDADGRAAWLPGGGLLLVFWGGVLLQELVLFCKPTELTAGGVFPPF